MIFYEKAPLIFMKIKKPPAMSVCRYIDNWREMTHNKMNKNEKDNEKLE